MNEVRKPLKVRTQSPSYLSGATRRSAKLLSGIRPRNVSGKFPEQEASDVTPSGN